MPRIRVNFYLNNNPDDDGNRLILLSATLLQKRVRASTKESIHPTKWNKKKQQANTSYTGGMALNDRLRQIEVGVENLFEPGITLEELKDKTRAVIAGVQGLDIPDDKLKKFTLYSFIEDFINSVDRKDSTKLTYRRSLRFVKEFAEAKRKSKELQFDEIDLDFYNDFSSYLKKDKNMATNTVASNIKNIKLFMNEALDRGLHSNRSFKSKRFKVITEETDNVYLNEAELDKIYNYDLSQRKNYEAVRDLFIIACWTGLRYSDIGQVKSENIQLNTNGQKMLKIRSSKTNAFVTIPLAPVVISIMEKYDNVLPKVISNQKMNKYLHDIVEDAGIKDEVNTSISKGGMTIDQAKKKFELVTFHTARRSFATNMYLRGTMGTQTIMAITGHKTEAVFQKYIKVDQEGHAELMMQEMQKDARKNLKAI